MAATVRSASGISAAVVEEAAWVATNLAAGDHATVAALLPAAPILIAHLGGGDGQAVAVQSAWALGPHMLALLHSCEITVHLLCPEILTVAETLQMLSSVAERLRISGAVVGRNMVYWRLPSYGTCKNSQGGGGQPCGCSSAGNIAGDGPEARRTLTANGAVRPLAALVMAAERSRRSAGEDGSLRAGQIAAWALSNVIKGAGHEVRRLPLVL